MVESIGKNSAQLSPLSVALKTAARDVVHLRRIKQDYLAARLGVDKATISRWLNPDEPQWPGYEKWWELAEEIKRLGNTLEHLRPLAHWFGAEWVGANSAEFGLTADTFSQIGAILAGKHGKVMALLIQALANDGVVDHGEAAGIAPEVRMLKILINELDERIQSVALGKAGAA